MNIFITEDISNTTANRVLQEILKVREAEIEKEKSIINVHINSHGGDLEAGYAIYDILRLSGYTINTFAISEVFSSAIIIYLAGDSRYATNYSSFMIHEPRHEYDKDDKDSMSANTYRRNLKELQIATNEYYKLISKHTTLTPQQLKNFCSNGRDCYFKTQEAKKWGLVTNVGIPI